MLYKHCILINIALVEYELSAKSTCFKPSQGVAILPLLLTVNDMTVTQGSSNDQELKMATT